jgi:hypothetical protein
MFSIFWYNQTSSKPFLNEMANDFEVYRYFDMHLRIKNGKYIESLPIIIWNNGVSKNEFQIIIESLTVLDEESKNKIKIQIKKDLPEMERKFKEMRENFYKDKIQNILNVKN